jgi:hypothetical protein
MAAIHDYFVVVAFGAVPVVIILVCNIGIVRVLRISQRHRESLTGEIKAHKNTNITIMLIFVSVAFIVFKLPNMIRMAVWYIFWAYYQGEGSPLITAVQRFSVTLSENIDYSNYAFNTYLYILSVRKFRQDAKNVCCCTKEHARGTSTHLVI